MPKKDFTFFFHTCALKPLFGVLDLIAKAPALNTKHNGRHGCPVCVHPGTWDGTCVYLPGNEHPLHTYESMIQDAIQAEYTQQPINGIKGRLMFSKFIDEGFPFLGCHFC